MAPRNVDSFVPSSLEDDLPDALIQANPNARTRITKQPPMQIVWRNVIAFIILHLAALYGLFLLPWCKPATWIWCKSTWQNINDVHEFQPESETKTFSPRLRPEQDIAKLFRDEMFSFHLFVFSINKLRKNLTIINLEPGNCVLKVIS